MSGCFGGGELGTHRTHLVVKRATEEAEVGFGELVERRGVGFEAGKKHRSKGLGNL